MSALVLRGGRVVCPKQGHDAVADVVVSDGRVRALAKPGTAVPDGAETLDVDGCWVLPGAIDLCCYTRDPGYEDDEPLATTLQSAARGGFTTVVGMPATMPATDGGDDVEQRLAAARALPGAALLVAGALTAKRRGEELAEIGEMVRAGAVAFTDAPDAVRDAGVLRRALEYVHGFNKPVFTTGADPALADGAVAAEGAVSTRLGLRGVPEAAETAFVARALELARLTGARVHLGALSAARSVDMLRAARADGLSVSGEVHPWHLLLDEAALLERAYDTSLRLEPPLRTARDREALLSAVRAGELLVASGHRPVGLVGKEVELDVAEPGGVSLPTALPLLAGEDAPLDATTVARATALGPAEVLGLKDRGHLDAGARADVVVIDPARGVSVDELVADRSAATPFRGQTTRSQVRLTLVGGEVAWRA